jgi:hypothetical protein
MMFLVWHRVHGEADELIGLFDSEFEMNVYYQVAMESIDPEDLHWTEVPVGWKVLQVAPPSFALVEGPSLPPLIRTLSPP